jgi:hypothetical protein
MDQVCFGGCKNDTWSAGSDVVSPVPPQDRKAVKATQKLHLMCRLQSIASMRLQQEQQQLLPLLLQW